MFDVHESRMAAAFVLLLSKETQPFYLYCDGGKKVDDSIKYLGLLHYYKFHTGGALSWFP